MGEMSEENIGDYTSANITPEAAAAMQYLFPDWWELDYNPFTDHPENR